MKHKPFFFSENSHFFSEPSTLNPKSFFFTLNPKPYTLHPKKKGSEKKGDFSEKIKYVVCEAAKIKH